MRHAFDADGFEITPSWPDLHDDPDLTEEWDMGEPSDPPDLTGKDDDTSVELMVEWFQYNFEDPAQGTPWDSEEGGYIYIWGGPYDTREELWDAFPDVSEQLIEAATNEIEADGWEWAPATSRMRPDAPKTNLIAAKHRLAEVLDDTEVNAVTAEFNPQAVALVLRELYLLQRRYRDVKAMKRFGVDK